MWTHQETPRWMEQKWMQASCLAAKNEYVLRNVAALQWIVTHTQGHEWAVMWTEPLLTRWRGWRGAASDAAPAARTESPAAAFNLRRPGPAHNLPVKTSVRAWEESLPAETTVRQRRRSEEPAFKSIKNKKNNCSLIASVGCRVHGSVAEKFVIPEVNKVLKS